MELLLEQCKNLYNSVFDDEDFFVNLLFENFYKDCRYILQDGKVVSMAFCIDVCLEKEKGKYIYAVATDKNYRGKGYMSRLLLDIEEEFKKDYAFLCLHPADNQLSEMYRKKGYSFGFYKADKINLEGVSVPVDSASKLKKIRESMLKNSVCYSEEYYKLFLSFTNAYCDDIMNPKKLLIVQKYDKKIVESIFADCKFEPSLTMYKSLKSDEFKKAYFGITLE